MEAKAAERRASDRRAGSDRRKGDRRTRDVVSKAQGSSAAIMQAGFILALQFVLIVIFCS